VKDESPIRIGTVAKQKTKPKLSNSALYFKEKCPCGTEIEFEASTGMVFDKMMARWDKAHAVHVEEAAHPPVLTPDMVAGVTISTDVNEKMMAAATKIEKEMLGDPLSTHAQSHGGDIRPATTQAAKKTKKPSVVEMEEASNKKWAERNKHERERVKILQRLGTGDLTQEEAHQLLKEVNDYERREQEQSARDDRAKASTKDVASSRV